MRKFYQNIFSCVFVAFLATFLACNKTKNYRGDESLGKEIIFAVDADEIKFTAEVFDTPESRAKGLMYRERLPKNHGGLFVFPDFKDQIFWMKNTYISLDIIFFDDDFKIVGIVENTMPLSLDYISINKKSRYALEVSAGTVKQYGINTSVKMVREQK